MYWLSSARPTRAPSAAPACTAASSSRCATRRGVSSTSRNASSSLAILRDRGVPKGDRLVALSRAGRRRTPFRERCAERPEAFGSDIQLPTLEPMKPPPADSVSERIDRRRGDADLRVRRGNAAARRRRRPAGARGSDGTPARTSAPGHVGPLGEREVGRRLADQRGDRVLELRARVGDVDQVGPRGQELRLGLHDVGARRDAGGVTFCASTRASAGTRRPCPGARA